MRTVCDAEDSARALSASADLIVLVRTLRRRAHWRPLRWPLGWGGGSPTGVGVGRCGTGVLAPSKLKLRVRHRSARTIKTKTQGAAPECSHQHKAGRGRAVGGCVPLTGARAGRRPAACRAGAWAVPGTAQGSVLHGLVGAWRFGGTTQGAILHGLAGASRSKELHCFTLAWPLGLGRGRASGRDRGWCG
jgi:hypothetical protein